MKKALVALLWLGFMAPVVFSEEPRVQEPSPWERSVVTIDATRKQYDYLQPWTKRLKTSQKSGLILDQRQILTTADELFDRTLVRVQRQGRGKWWAGELVWIDYHANLALVSVADEGFWKGLVPAKLSEPTRGEGDFQIVRWRQGRLETRRAEFNQFTSNEGRLSYAPHLQMELISEIQGSGSAEPLISKTEVEGLLSGQEGKYLHGHPFILLFGRSWRRAGMAATKDSDTSILFGNRPRIQRVSRS